MFRRLADRVNSALGGNATTSDVETLRNMGFSEAEARSALQQNDQSVQRAAEWLLTHGTPTSAAAHTATATQTEDDELQRALQASMLSSPAPVRSAASHRAGQAALARFERKNAPATKKPPAKTTTTTAVPQKPIPSTETPVPSHPNVQVPKQLSQYDKEEVILRCANRIAPNSRAVDTLLKSLKTLQQNPRHPKFQTIDTQSAGFQKSLQAPGVLDFFKAMNYHSSPHNPKVLRLAFCDPATLYLGISALEQVQQTSLDYQDDKASLVFDKEISEIMELGDKSADEAVRRSEYMSKLPSEPNTGGGIITVELGGTTKISRKFDGDDILADVISFIGGHGSRIVECLESGKWFLVNRNHANAPPYNLKELRGKTLQYIGCWPSARLAIVPMPPSRSGRLPSQSRGLGAAPLDHVH